MRENIFPDHDAIDESEELTAHAVYGVGYVGGGTFASAFALYFDGQGVVIKVDYFSVDSDGATTIVGVEIYRWLDSDSGYEKIEELDELTFSLCAEHTRQIQSLGQAWAQEFCHKDDAGGEALLFAQGREEAMRTYDVVSEKIIAKNVMDWEEDIEDAMWDISAVWGLNLKFG